MKKIAFSGARNYRHRSSPARLPLLFPAILLTHWLLNSTFLKGRLVPPAVPATKPFAPVQPTLPDAAPVPGGYVRMQQQQQNRVR
ncbi:hypothetical protein [Botryobacter ruber]|uniref:hypothetical protein n=1 Tax=Botryobacter ruber TaxID=2171629 RepID=UPI000FEC6482|nr:hypothetical protein [Botryobacter ruber]